MSLLGSRTEKQLSFWRHEPEGRRPQQDQKKIQKKTEKIPLNKTRPSIYPIQSTYLLRMYLGPQKVFLCFPL